MTIYEEAADVVAKLRDALPDTEEEEPESSETALAIDDIKDAVAIIERLTNALNGFKEAA
jgi:hypothetical protein